MFEPTGIKFSLDPIWYGHFPFANDISFRFQWRDKLIRNRYRNKWITIKDGYSVKYNTFVMIRNTRKNNPIHKLGEISMTLDTFTHNFLYGLELEVYSETRTINESTSFSETNYVTKTIYTV